MRSRNLFALSLLLLSGCAHVAIPNTEWCGDMGSEGASCFHTLTDDARDLTKEQWDTERFGQVCTTLNDFAAMKTSLEQLCSMAGRRCSYYARKALRNLQARAYIFAARSYQVKIQEGR